MKKIAVMKLKETLTIRELIDNFKINKTSFWYKVHYGVYLSFCSDDLEYEGIETYYLIPDDEIKILKEKGIDELKKKGLVIFDKSKY